MALLLLKAQNFTFQPSSFRGSGHQDIGPSSETITLVEKLQIPVKIDGKEVGKTTLPAGTKVTVLSRDGAMVSIKRGNVGPVWIKESELSGLSDKKQEQASKPVELDTDIELQRLAQLVSQKKWAQVANTCETLVQADVKFSGLAELAGQLKGALQGQASAVHQLKKVEAEAQRVRRNADVVGRSLLNPDDKERSEKADQMRRQADRLLEEAQTAIEFSDATLMQIGETVLAVTSSLDKNNENSVARPPLPPGPPTPIKPRTAPDFGQPSILDSYVTTYAFLIPSQKNIKLTFYAGWVDRQENGIRHKYIILMGTEAEKHAPLNRFVIDLNTHAQVVDALKKSVVWFDKASQAKLVAEKELASFGTKTDLHHMNFRFVANADRSVLQLSSNADVIVFMNKEETLNLIQLLEKALHAANKSDKMNEDADVLLQ